MHITLGREVAGVVETKQHAGMETAEGAVAELAQVFADYAVAVGYDDLGPEAVRAAKQSTLDTLGVILGASGLQGAAEPVARLFGDWGGAEESTVLGFGGRLPAPSAAFVNGTMAHGLDFDDHLPEGHHPSSTLVPTLLAVAEREGGITGQEFLTAVAIGQDLFARLRRNVVWRQDWFITPVIGAITSAVAAAKLLRLDRRQMVSVIGIATVQAAGTMQLAYGTGGDLRGTYAGFAAKNAVTAAYLAAAGLTGTTTPLEGRAGFLEVYFRGEYDREAMVRGLGHDFQGAEIVYKLWPSCGASHGYIDATSRLLGAPGRGSEIERIEVIGGDFAQRLSEPIDERRVPASELDAKFSIPYTVAVTVVRGTVGLGDFSDERRRDPAVVEVARTIHFVEDARYDWSEELPASAVRITLVDGTVLEAETSHADTPGSTENPLTWEELEEKFTDCAGYGARPVSAANLGEVVRRIRHLEDVADVSELAGLLV